jgi:hypothetical protein
MFFATKRYALEVLKWTGGKSVQALDVYIDLAFAEVENYKDVVQAVDLVRHMEVFDQRLTRLANILECDRDVDSFLQNLSRLIKSRNDDFGVA